ncbi:MAG: glycosyltransferase [Weeksellaceae bacterium]
MKKKIGFVIESLQLGGAEKSLVTLLQHLDDSKYEIDLIYFHPDGFFKEMVPKTVHQIVLDFPKISFFERLKYAFKKKTVKNYHNAQLFWPLMEPHLENFEKEYDIAVAYNQGFATYFTQKFISAETKYAWVNTDYRKAGYNIGFDKDFYADFKKVVCVSPENKAGFTKVADSAGLDIEVEIIKDISDEDFIRKQAGKEMKISFQKDKINVVSVGRLVDYKGFEMAVKSCSVLVKKGIDVNWYIIGEGAQRNELEKLIKENQLKNHFYLPGADANPYPYIKNCDIYVQTSLFEGLGLTVIEAAMLHKPIVCTSFPTVFSILKDNETGLIVEMNPESISAGIERLINDKELKNRLTENLKNQKNNDTEITMKKVEELLK